MTVFHVVLMKCVKPKGSILSIESVIYQFVETILQNLLSYKKIHEISRKILYKLYDCIIMKVFPYFIPTLYVQKS